jgi:carbamoyl-phosphate synthase large subunit
VNFQAPDDRNRRGCAPRTQWPKAFSKARKSRKKSDFPLVLRPSYTLGGTGGGFVHDPAKFDQALTHALHSSPIHEVLIEESIWGWKEFELEVLRDYAGNHIVICSIENLDPMGIHTGDSITVAPAMTLPDTQMQHMRNVAFKVMDAIGEFCGGCNVQFSIDPDTGRMIVIEINPRVSRSSALASKATGYPDRQDCRQTRRGLPPRRTEKSNHRHHFGLF